MIWAVLAYVIGIFLAFVAALILVFFLLRLLRNLFTSHALPELEPGLAETLVALAVFLPLASLFAFLLAWGTGFTFDGPEYGLKWLMDAVFVATGIDLLFLGILALFIGIAALIALITILYELVFILPSEIVKAIKNRSLLRSLGSFAVSFVIVVCFLLIALSIVVFLAGSEWTSISMPDWLSTSLRALGMGIFGLLLFILASIGVAAILLVFRFGVDVLTLGRTREPTVRRWLEAPWTDEDQQEVSYSLPQSALKKVARSASRGVAAVLGAASGGHNEKPVFRGTEKRAQEIATQRKIFVQKQVREYRRVPPKHEVIEIPPSLLQLYTPRALNEQSGHARVIELLYQTSQEQSLLFGRVVDAISCFLRTKGFGSSDPIPATEIVLRKLSWWEKWPGEYPWVVLVRTQRSRDFIQFLEPLRDWLGIGVRTAKPVGWIRQRNCTYSNARGTVAGYIGTKDQQVKYALTCAHVLPTQCSAHRLTRTGEAAANQPDAALLHQHPCVAQLENGKRVRFVSHRFLQQLWVQKTSVHRAGGYSARAAGYVKHPDAAYVAKDGTIEDFPACVVQTKRLRYAWGLVPRPFFRKRFSDEGDSGSWVMVRRADTNPSCWVGMIVAGGDDDNRMESYVLKAMPLMLYLRRELGCERPLIPHLTEDF